MKIKDIQTYIMSGSRIAVRFNSNDSQPVSDIRVGKLKAVLEDTVVIDKFQDSELPPESLFKCNIDGPVLIPAESIIEIMII